MCVACGQVMCWLLLLVIVGSIVLDFLSVPFSVYLQMRRELRDSDCMSVSVCMDNDMPAHSHGAYVKCQLSIVWGVYCVYRDVSRTIGPGQDKCTVQYVKCGRYHATG